jgi:diaminohydroxyphosphoribosylaminopyrimidine deaminase/5-amino-6-(5-phosphoribosylamino)uracil reductase
MRDAVFMARALALAARARGQTSPNPLVGAVVVSDDGRVLGAGFHARAGEPHAEVNALRDAGPAARGATLVCTLEPCSHHGRTPPCAAQVVAAGIRRVVVATGDPNPLVSGAGFRYLEAHGVQVSIGVGRPEAERLNRPFFTVMREGRPWVLAKAALSGDGWVAAGPGQRTAISGTASNRQSHLLRAEVDALAVGAGTVLSDDPALTCRDVYRGRPLVRVVFDRRLRVSPRARVFAAAPCDPVWIVTGDVADADRAERARRLTQAGAVLLPVSGAGLAEAFRLLATRGVQSMLLEGGPSLHRAALGEDLVDRVRVIASTRMLGPGGVPWITRAELGLPSLSDLRVEPCGDDVIVEGNVYRTHRTCGPGQRAGAD